MDVCLDIIRFSIGPWPKQSIQMHYKYSQDNEKQTDNFLTFMFLHDDMVTITIMNIHF